MRCDIAIIGGGLGGIGAALAACELGRRVVLTDATDWLGGQLTQQAVPLNEHRWVEFCGCTRSYRRFRAAVRRYYLTHYPLTEAARHTRPSVDLLNPGNAIKCGLCHEPRVAVAAIEGMLEPYVRSNQLEILLEHEPVSADVDGDRVRSITLESMVTGEQEVIEFDYVLDATEAGDLLPLTGTEYITGSEAQSETGEPHASMEARPLNIEAVTACFGLDYTPGEDLTIDRPEMYDFWRAYRPEFWPGPFLAWTDLHPATHEPRYANLFTHQEHGRMCRGRWLEHRILDRRNFVPESFTSDITLVNWPMNSYLLGPVFEVPEDEALTNIEGAKQLSLSLLYWMQTEANRPDGGLGYPGLGLRMDVVGSEDGLAKHVFLRESRRIRAELTLCEQHLSEENRAEDDLADAFDDSVGIGYSPILVHPTTEGDNYLYVPVRPFQIPLRALLPVRVENLLPAARNLGTTHLTGSSCRPHPVEWNVGEAAGSLAAFCVEHDVVPRAVPADGKRLLSFQSQLARQGFELDWQRLPVDWNEP